MNLCDPRGFVILCIGPWQTMQGTVEVGVWYLSNVPDDEFEYELTTPFNVDFLVISILVWQPLHDPIVIVPALWFAKLVPELWQAELSHRILLWTSRVTKSFVVEPSTLLVVGLPS